MQYTNHRDDYDSDEQYANFRCVAGGNLKDDFLYRGCTPSTPIVGDRYTYVQELMEKNNIGFSINLSNTKEEIDELSKTPMLHEVHIKEIFMTITNFMHFISLLFLMEVNVVKI